MMKLFRARTAGDDGISMITVILIGALLSAMAASMAVISSNNLRNAGRDRVAGSAMGAAEAGIAQAIAYLRTTNPVTELACSPDCGAANPWGEDDPGLRQRLTFPDGGTADVHIEVDQPFNPPSVTVAVYTIKSDGTAGTGPGLRRLEQTVTVEPLPFPIGVYSNKINLNGTPQTFQQSVFSTECITGREKMEFNGTDAFYGIPAAAHSTKYISTGNNRPCEPNENQNIHKTVDCNPAYPFDQDNLGGPVGGACTGVPGGTSYFDQAALDQFGRPLTNDELATLRVAAQSQGQYYNGTTSINPPDPTVYPNAVLFFDLAPNQSISIQNELDAYEWDSTCTNPRTLIIVVNHSSVGSGQVKLNSNADLAGAIFVQRGDFEFNGTATFTGTLVSNSISKWNGNATSALTACFLDNLPPGAMEITATRFREVDS